MAPPVVGDDAEALAEEEQHLVVPVVGAQRPTMVEHDRLTGAPVLVENLRAVFRLDAVHDLTPIFTGCIWLSSLPPLAARGSVVARTTAPVPIRTSRLVAVGIVVAVLVSISLPLCGLDAVSLAARDVCCPEALVLAVSRLRSGQPRTGAAVAHSFRVVGMPSIISTTSLDFESVVINDLGPSNGLPPMCQPSV